MITCDRFENLHGDGEDVDRGRVGCTLVLSGTTNDGNEGFDGAKQKVEGTMHGDVFISFVVLLEGESNGDRIGCVNFRMIMREFVAMLEEANILKGEYFCSTLFAC